MQIDRRRVPARGLQREVALDVYQPEGGPHVLLLMNDGQDLPVPPAAIPPGVWVAAVHAGPQRRQEYGVAGVADYKGDGALAAVYSQFVIKELLPFLEREYPSLAGVKRAFAGFSLGGLSALDIVWQHPQHFSMAGVFSGALWWRSRPLDAAYSDERDRIIHRRIRESTYRPGLQFFFECGSADETADRNGNGIIDSIDDTRDLITELVKKGYREPEDITYLEVPGGRHDKETWGRAMEVFLGLIHKKS
ncbi:esterase [Chitinophaga oryzae]|uniref:Esterase n=1 Tax=Chitinophaga oryzae TaxID=2725414 RepID=A0ABX6L922_9BACT|nr:alpha/beta hydrolase-fold protein [Chitinophaga oryzae]QJB36459.1 esterase [Chitinophaga oryzae]